MAALPKTTPYELGEWIDFGEGGNAIPYETGGWWIPEPRETWTTEQAGLTIDIGGEATSDLTLEALATAFVNPNNPAVDAEILVNDVPSGKWKFRFERGAPEFQIYRTVLSQKALNKAFPPVIRFRVSGAGAPAGEVCVAIRACSDWECATCACCRGDPLAMINHRGRRSRRKTL